MGPFYKQNGYICISHVLKPLLSIRAVRIRCTKIINVRSYQYYVALNYRHKTVNYQHRSKRGLQVFCSSFCEHISHSVCLAFSRILYIFCIYFNVGFCTSKNNGKCIKTCRSKPIHHECSPPKAKAGNYLSN